MNTPCQILVDGDDAAACEALTRIAAEEAERIEAKYSRYRAQSIVSRINASAGRPFETDAETAALLDFAAQSYTLSEGLFDITTGALRRVWTFDGQDAAPSERQLAEALSCVGWQRVSWTPPTLQLPPGYEIDLGGICKEYAADRIVGLLRAQTDRSVLANLGGDVVAAGDRRWSVGIEDPEGSGRMLHVVALRDGAVATSGTTRRFVRYKGRVLGHILHPKTGWPVESAPRSVSVAAKTCTEAGLWSTLALLHGAAAEEYLAKQGLDFWCYR